MKIISGVFFNSPFIKREFLQYSYIHRRTLYRNILEIYSRRNISIPVLGVNYISGEILPYLSE